ncbi:hypothetical protein HUJ04_002427 [Dendroctonus ponderosae]|nr:hypothetical protein HUJ04_002427 [Dendroctonus ponderosae]
MIWRTFIEDLSILGITVLASISSVSPIFYGAIEIMIQLKSILNLYSPMVYSVHPFARIVHLFDHNSLINRFDDLMKECDRIYFLQPMAASQSEIVSSHELRLMKTSHQAIKSYQAELGNTNMSIYDQRFREKIEKASYPRGKAWTRGVQSFLTATELVAKLGDMDTYWLSRNLTACYEMLEEFRILLATVHFGSDMSNVNRDPICSSGIAVLYLRDPVSYRTPGSRNSFCFHGNIPINIHTCFLLAVLYDDREVYQKLLGGFYDQDSYYEASDTASCVSTSSSSLSGESETSEDLIFHKADNDHESAENSLSDTEADKNAVYMIKLFKIATQRDRIVEIFNFACGAFTNSLDVITEIREQPLITHIKTKITTITESTNSLLDQLRMKIHNKDVAPGESCNTLIGSTSTATEANDTLLCIKIIENEMKECAQALAGLLQWVKYISYKVTKVYDHDTDLRKMNYYYNIVDNYHTIVNIYLDSYSSSTLEEQEHQIPDKLAKVHSNATDESTTRNCLFQNDPYNSDNNADCNAVSEQHAILFFEQMFQLQKITVQLAQNISNGSLVKTFKIPTQGHVVLTHIARPKEANKTQQPNNVPLKIAQDPHDELNKLKRFLDGLFTESGTVKPIDSFRETTVTVQVILNHLQLFWETILEKRIQEVKNNGIRIDEKNNEVKPLVDQTEKTKNESYESTKTLKRLMENKNTDRKEDTEKLLVSTQEEYKETYKDLIEDNATSNHQTNEREKEHIQTTETRASQDYEEQLIKGSDKQEISEKQPVETEEKFNKNNSTSKNLIEDNSSNHQPNERGKEEIETTETNRSETDEKTVIKDSEKKEHSEKHSVETEEKRNKDNSALKYLIEPNATSNYQTNERQNESMKPTETKPSEDNKETLIKDKDKKENAEKISEGSEEESNKDQIKIMKNN